VTAERVKKIGVRREIERIFPEPEEVEVHTTGLVDAPAPTKLALAPESAGFASGIV
jgi:hypothetical protein